jgi:hypothetical protein
MLFPKICSIIKRSDESPALTIMNEVLSMFKKKQKKIEYDKTNKKAVLKCSICNGEQVAGFKDLDTGHFDEIMLIRNTADLDEFMEMYDVAAITKEY